MAGWLTTVWAALTGRRRANATAGEVAPIAREAPGQSDAAGVSQLQNRPPAACTSPAPPPPAPALQLEETSAAMPVVPAPRPDFRLAERLAATRVLNRPSGRLRRAEAPAMKSVAPRRHVWLEARPARSMQAEVVQLPRPLPAARPMAEAA